MSTDTTAQQDRYVEVEVSYSYTVIVNETVEIYLPPGEELEDWMVQAAVDESLTVDLTELDAPPEITSWEVLDEDEEEDDTEDE